jgi:hypothetical protein
MWPLETPFQMTSAGNLKPEAQHPKMTVHLPE